MVPLMMMMNMTIMATIILTMAYMQTPGQRRMLPRRALGARPSPLTREYLP